MKLVQGRIAHADTITTDDGVQLGVIYYGVAPVDDEGTKPETIFRQWWELHQMIETRVGKVNIQPARRMEDD